MQIFCDLDGVLADFDSGVKTLLGVNPHDVPPKMLWDAITNEPSFYETLPKFIGFDLVWGAIAQYDPIILTGCPYSGYEAAANAKRKWCEKHLGSEVQVITCMSRDKHKHIQNPGDILIDDRQSNINNWCAAGGIGILHANYNFTLGALGKLINSR